MGRVIQLPDDAMLLDYLPGQYGCPGGPQCNIPEAYFIGRAGLQLYLADDGAIVLVPGGASKLDSLPPEFQFIAEALKDGSPAGYDWRVPPPGWVAPTPSASDAADELKSETRHLFERSASGPENLGGKVEVTGKTIQLPEDAWIESWILFIDCATGTKCPRAPVLVIRGGTSEVQIDADGVVGDNVRGIYPLTELAPEFDFIRRALSE
jgi:hypothetical protein